MQMDNCRKRKEGRKKWTTYCCVVVVMHCCEDCRRPVLVVGSSYADVSASGSASYASFSATRIDDKTRVRAENPTSGFSRFCRRNNCATCNLSERERSLQGSSRLCSGSATPPPALSSSSSSSAMALLEAINKKELKFAAICALVGVAALYVAVPRSQLLLSEPAIPTKRSNGFALNPKQWVNFTLQESHRVTHNTRTYRFAFDPDAKLGLPVASCLLTRAELTTAGTGRSYTIIRPYTPISDPNAKGYCDLMVKFYPEGKMSRHIAQLKPGDTLEVNGPVAKLPYKANMKRHLGMIAGGTGITPMLQIIDAILSNPNDYTQLSLLYANVSPENILLKDKLDALAHAHPNFKVFYMVDIAATDWTGGLGRINKDVIVKGLPYPSHDTLILVCGPPGLVEHVCGDKEDEHSQGEVIRASMFSVLLTPVNAYIFYYVLNPVGFFNNPKPVISLLATKQKYFFGCRCHIRCTTQLVTGIHDEDEMV